MFEVDAAELESKQELGRGAYGVVELMLHGASNTLMAVKVCFLTGLSN